MTHTLVIKSELELEKTDIGPTVDASLQGWLTGTVPAECVSLFIAARLEESLRLKVESSSSDRSRGYDFVCGGIGSVLDRSALVYRDWFVLSPEAALHRAFVLLEHPIPRQYSDVSISRINIVFRRLSLRSRWASTIAEPVRADASNSIDLSSLHIAMELARAYVNILSPVRKLPISPSAILDDESIVRELNSDPTNHRPPDETVELINTQMETYLITLMKLKSQGMELLTDLEESSIYSILGISSSASDAEVKRAYKSLAMQLHPDKGGDTELFQQLTDAYEKILEKRGLNKTNAVEVDVKVKKKSEGVRQEESKTPPTLMERILKSAEDCVKSAKLTSELTSKIASMVGAEGHRNSTDVKALIAMLIKAVRLSGYASLDTSAAALDAARTMSDTSSTEKISTVTNLASELMNAGFDALNNCGIHEDDVIDKIAEAAGKAVASAAIATKLARAVESLTKKTSEEEGFLTQIEMDENIAENRNSKSTDQRRILRALNNEIKAQQIEITCLLDGRVGIDISWAIVIINAFIGNCVTKVERKFQSSILVRSVEQIVQIFKNECVVFRLKPELAVSTDPFVRLARLVLLTSPATVVDALNGTVIPKLADLVSQRNKLIAREIIEKKIKGLLFDGSWEDMAMRARSKAPSGTSKLCIL